MNGPMALAMPPKPDQAPIALPRSSSANEASMMARLPGVSSAPPTCPMAPAAAHFVETPDRGSQRSIAQRVVWRSGGVARWHRTCVPDFEYGIRRVEEERHDGPPPGRAGGGHGHWPLRPPGGG